MLQVEEEQVQEGPEMRGPWGRGQHRGSWSAGSGRGISSSQSSGSGLLMGCFVYVVRSLDFTPNMMGRRCML